MTRPLTDWVGLPGTNWWDRWLDWRDRLLASPSFQRRAARWWPFRMVAHARARKLFDLVAGFVYSQVLLACVRLGLFDALSRGALPGDVLARRLGLSPEVAQRLLDAARALGLVERRGACWGLGPLGAPLANNAALAAMVEHHATLYGDLADPVALLRGDAIAQLQGYWAYAGSSDPAALPAGAVEAYSRLMASSQPLVASEILESYCFGRHRCVLDVGGGDGRFLQSLGEQFPKLDRMLFDLPAVVELARARLGPSVRLEGGDFLRDPLPVGADLVTFVRVLHDHDDRGVATLLASASRALPPGGSILVAEPLAGTPSAGAMGDAYFNFYLLAMGQGRPRRSSELAEQLTAAGFSRVRQLRTGFPLQASVLHAIKPV
jgi:demethylspheroidene O-methyltransferase